MDAILLKVYTEEGFKFNRVYDTIPVSRRLHVAAHDGKSNRWFLSPSPHSSLPESALTVRTYLLSSLFRGAIGGLIQIFLAFLMLVLIGEALIHWPEIRFKLLQRAHAVKSLLIETPEKSANE